MGFSLYTLWFSLPILFLGKFEIFNLSNEHTLNLSFLSFIFILLGIFYLNRDFLMGLMDDVIYSRIIRLQYMSKEVGFYFESLQELVYDL